MVRMDEPVVVSLQQYEWIALAEGLEQASGAYERMAVMMEGQDSPEGARVLLGQARLLADGVKVIRRKLAEAGQREAEVG